HDRLVALRRRGIRSLYRSLRLRRAARPERGGSGGGAGDDRGLRDARAARPRRSVRADLSVRPRPRACPALLRRGARLRAVPGALAVKIAVDILLGLAVVV